ncbi:MAG TPA: hypothetical protein VGL60_10315 [Acidimicrobiales bacterium]|jgi:hypothetical protein
MGKLYGYLLFVLLAFSAAIGLMSAGIFGSDWIPLVVGAALLVVTLAIAGLLVRDGRRGLDPDETKVANSLLAAFGAFCTLEVLTMGLVLWAWGNRSLHANNWYQVLGLLIFLALVGIGVQGALATPVMFIYARSKLVARRSAVDRGPGYEH